MIISPILFILKDKTIGRNSYNQTNPKGETPINYIPLHKIIISGIVSITCIVILQINLIYLMVFLVLMLCSLSKYRRLLYIGVGFSSLVFTLILYYINFNLAQFFAISFFLSILFNVIFELISLLKYKDSSFDNHQIYEVNMLEP